MRPSRLLPLAALLLLAAAAGLLVLRARAPRNLIVVSIDTLRADRLGTYGYGRPTSPHLDALARQGLVVDAVVAESPWTLPSHVTMLSGLDPSTHGVVLPWQRPGEKTRLLAQLLATHGYETAAITDGEFVGSSHGFGAGFEHFDEEPKPFATTVDRAIAFLEGRSTDRPYLLFLHTYDVHCPYTPAGQYATMFVSPDRAPVETEGLCDDDFNAMGISPAQATYLSDLYDGDIRHADAELGRLFAHLRRTGGLHDTVVVVTSDHGEEFLEHGKIGHVHHLHRETLLIPMIIAGAGVAPGRLPGPAGLADLVPTLFDLLGLPAPPDLDGRSLVASTPIPEWRVSQVDYEGRRRSLRTATHHLTVDEEARRRLFNLRADPAEQVDVAAGEPGLTRELTAHLETHQARQARPIDRAGELSPFLVQRLRNLGYIGATEPPDAAAFPRP